MNTKTALTRAFTGELERRNGFIVVPTTLFVPAVDIEMPPLPAVEFYEEKDGKPVLLRKANQPYSPLALSKREYVLVPVSDDPKLRDYAQRSLIDPSLMGAQDRKDRMQTLREAAIQTVENLFREPSPENIKKSSRVVNSFVYVLMREPEAYLLLSRLSSHDPYTLQHSVGTAVNSIILARKLGIKDEKELEATGLGGLLHDIGKVKVDPEIINKEGPLDEFEWGEMRKHSEYGYEILSHVAGISEITKNAVLQHHEDQKGTGYPKGLILSQLPIHSRIVSISDIFNALTTNRSYSKAKTPFDAFQFIREKLQHKIDEELYAELVKIYGGWIPAA